MLQTGTAMAALPVPASILADVPKIKARLLLQYAQNDENINKGIEAYREALEKAQVPFSIFIYEGTQHAFNNDTSAARYNKAAAELAWSRTIEQHRAKGQPRPAR